MLIDLRKELEPAVPDTTPPPVEHAAAPPEIATTVTPTTTPPVVKKTPPVKPPQPPAKPAIQPAPVETPELIKLAAVRNELAPLEREFHFSAALEALQRKLED